MSTRANKIQKWGNSAAVRLNQAVLSQFGYGIGDEVLIDVVDGEIVIRHSDELTLDELLKGSPQELLAPTSEEIEWEAMPPAGNEI